LRTSTQDVFRLKNRRGNSFPQVLRFLRLFGGTKVGSLPNIWRNCKGRRKKRSRLTSAATAGNQEVSDGVKERECTASWKVAIPPTPPLDACLSDEEVRRRD